MGSLDLVQDSDALLHDSGALLAETRGLLDEARGFIDGAPTPAGDRPSGLERRKGTRVRLLAAIPITAGLLLVGVAIDVLVQGSAEHAFPAATTSRPQATASPRVVTPTADAPPGFVPLWVSIPRLSSQARVDGPVKAIRGGPGSWLLSAPPNYHDLGWFRPSTGGPLVLDGQVGHSADPGPLALIGGLHAGDLVLVGTQIGPVGYRVDVVATAQGGRLPAKYFTPAYGADLMLVAVHAQSPSSGGHSADNVYVVAQPSG